MGRWGSADFKELKRLRDRLDKLAKADFDTFCRETSKELAGRLLTKVKKRTPVVYGTLRNNWAIMPVRRNKDEYTVTVVNYREYASYVEYGHRQQPGRFVPGYWDGNRFLYDANAKGGIVLTKSWVKGRFMLTISSKELENQAPAILERKLAAFLKEALDGN